MSEQHYGPAADHGVAVTIDGPIAELTLTRPAKLNALDLPMVHALEDAVIALERAPGLRAACLRGEGRGFCAGGDITAWSGMAPLDYAQDWVRLGHRVFDRLARLKIPVIAVLDGDALGGGLELAACADFRIAERHIKLGMPETALGVIPGWSGTQRAVRRFGSQLVRRMAIGGDIFDAETAERLGLVDRVVDTGAARQAALDWAGVIAGRAPTAIQSAKLLINIAEAEEIAGAAEALASAYLATTADLVEGVAGFREKRKPDFPGR
jgi:enoyl-CoA hydratase